MRNLLKNQRNFALYAWFVLGFSILVILWGTFVRATGSGAGCGSHWPLCNGVVVPVEPATETIIEFFHRITSALSGVLVLGLLAWAFYLYPKGHPVRGGSVLSTIFIITEGLVGAGLVLFELVAHNQSTERVYWMAAHLINTFLLLAALSLTAWWATGGRPIRLRGQGKTAWLLLGGVVLLILLGVSGAVTALGDTLFPSGSLAEGIAQDFEATAHFLVRLRIWHPIIAIGTGIYLIVASSIIYEEKSDRQTYLFSRALRVLFLVQIAAGTVNVLLLAPVWMQIVHLFLADLVWISAILFGAAALAVAAPATQVEDSASLVAQAGD